MAQTSYPKDKIKILLLENISDAAVRELKQYGYRDIQKINGALTEEELMSAVKGIHLLGIRSKTRITKNVIAAADKLVAIGAFCIGVNQVDLKAATQKGVAIFNAPHANTRSVAELIIGLSVMLIRKIADKNAAAHRGEWLKDATGSFELRGKTLGIIGYGNIGSQVSNMAEAMGMHVVYYDVATKLPHGNAKQIRDVKALLKESHIVTLHVPSDSTTRNLIDADAIKSMRKGAIVINHSRGDVVDLDALEKSDQVRQACGCGSRRVSGRTRKIGRCICVRTAKPAERDPHAAYRRLDRRSASEHRSRCNRKARQISRAWYERGLAYRPARFAAAASRDASYPAHPSQYSRRARRHQLASVKTQNQHRRAVPEHEPRHRLRHPRCRIEDLERGVRDIESNQRYSPGENGVLTSTGK